MDIIKVLSIYAGIYIMVNLMLYSAIPQGIFGIDTSSLGSSFASIPAMLGIIINFITFPFTTVFPLLSSQFPVLAIVYLIITLPAYFGIFYIFLQGLFWLVSKLLG